jgi:hypothetical protein
MPVTTDRYPFDPNDVGKQIEDRFRAIEQSINALAGRNPLNSAVFSGTTRNVDPDGNTVGSWGPDGFKFYDTAGNLLLSLGATGFFMYDADAETRLIIGATEPGAYGVIVNDADGTTPRLWIDETGIRSPFLASPFVAADDYKAVTSGTYVITHRAQVELITSPGLYVWVTAASDPGTTGEVRLRNNFTGATTEAVTIPAGSSGTVQQFRWLHGSDLNEGPIVFEVQARRTAGTGNLNVYRPPSLTLTDPGLCVADGIA